MSTNRCYPQADDTLILGILKGCEQYFLFYDHESQGVALRTLGRWASNPELSFTRYDSAELSNKMRRPEMQSHEIMKCRKAR